MTLAMPDSITPANLKPGYGQYLAYVDGEWATAAAVRAKFPAARILTLTVLGGNAVADGCDREPGDLDPVSAVAWAARRIAAGAQRPVLYASAGNMADVLAEMAAQHVGRSQVRLLSAHYGAGEHICAPAVCGYPEADGTQWTDTYPGVNGSLIDMSALRDDFFGGPAVTPIPLNICGTYTNAEGALFVVGTDHAGVLCEAKRTAPGVWSAPYPIAGKTGA